MPHPVPHPAEWGGGAPGARTNAAAWALAWLTATPVRWLMVFDNVEDIEELHPLLGRLARGHVLITTGVMSAGTDLGTVLRLDVLRPRPAAVELLAEMIGPAVGGERAGLEELAGELDGLPLALKQAGAYIARTPGMTVAAYLDLLRTAPQRALAATPAPTAAPPPAAAQQVRCPGMGDHDPGASVRRAR